MSSEEIDEIEEESQMTIINLIKNTSLYFKQEEVINQPVSMQDIKENFNVDPKKSLNQLLMGDFLKNTSQSLYDFLKDKNIH